MVIPQDFVCCLKSENHLNTVADPGEESGPPPYSSHKLRPEGLKKLFWDQTPPPLISGSRWLDPPPPYLKVWICHCNKLNLSLRVWKGLLSSGLQIKWGCNWVWLIPDFYQVTWQSGLVNVSTQIGGPISKCFLHKWYFKYVLILFTNIINIFTCSNREEMFDRNAKAILDCIEKTGMLWH